MLQTCESSTDEQNERMLPGYRDEDVIFFEEGLIGFPGCKRFILMENESLSPFRIFQCVDDRMVGFLVLDPRTIVKNYDRSIPVTAWQSLDVTETENRLSLVISIVGKVPEESTANLQAPLLINYKRMTGKQLILTNSRYSVTQPLVPSRRLSARRRAAGAAGTNWQN